ncbi:MAG: phosphodiester glycosidase family protein [Fibrobacteres bacterium]|nr:phosphodiester glycosidase family protein [Fibrobacterota bacterium]
MLNRIGPCEYRDCRWLRVWIPFLKSVPLWFCLLGCFVVPLDHPRPFPPTTLPRTRSLDSLIVSEIVDPRSLDVSLHWKDDSGKILGSLAALKSHLESSGKSLALAMNGGMFDTGFTSHGLFVQEGSVIHPLDTSAGEGNFYLEPNGIFLIDTSGRARITPTDNFRDSGQVRYATQSGPMLVIDSAIHPAFIAGSKNLNIRNGVGILSDGRLLFAISRTEINFHDFATFFLRHGCANALFLDGFVSRAYMPSKNWIQTDGEFGVMIGVTKGTDLEKAPSHHAR